MNSYFVMSCDGGWRYYSDVTITYFLRYICHVFFSDTSRTPDTDVLLHSPHHMVTPSNSASCLRRRPTILRRRSSRQHKSLNRDSNSMESITTTLEIRRPVQNVANYSLHVRDVWRLACSKRSFGVPCQFQFFFATKLGGLFPTNKITKDCIYIRPIMWNFPSMLLHTTHCERLEVQRKQIDDSSWNLFFDFSSLKMLRREPACKIDLQLEWFSERLRLR